MQNPSADERTYGAVPHYPANIVPQEQRLPAPELANYHGRAVRGIGATIGVVVIGLGIGVHALESRDAENYRAAAEQIYQLSAAPHDARFRYESDALANKFVNESRTDAKTAKLAMDLGWRVGLGDVVVLSFMGGGLLNRREKADNEQRKADYLTRVKAHEASVAAQATAASQENS